jgi:Enoyl-CoA hydratase/carnithine racemase
MTKDKKPERIHLPSHGDLDVEFDHATNSVWAFMNHKGRPSFTLSMMKNVRDHDATLETTNCKVAIGGVCHDVDYYVGASRLPGVYNLGGDLSLFLLLIKSRDREALCHYARLCIDCLWARINNFGSRHITTISLVQGDALGGGFESVLASDVIIAEEQSRLGFPEVMFNLFPGMGAQSLLTRRIGAQRAEELIYSGRLIGAQELHEMGIVDVVAKEGQGERAVDDFILRNQRRLNTLRSIHHCRQIVNPVTREELDAIADVWVDAALRLNDRDLKLMGRVVRSQLKLIENAPAC